MIYYFSGTGNSRWAAEKLAEYTGDVCCSISEAKEIPESAVKQPVEKKTPAANKVPQKATTKAGSYIIVASLATNSDAMQVVKQMQQKGYKEAQILESDGRFRVAINRYTNQTDAYKQIKELKRNADFASAWVLTTK